MVMASFMGPPGPSDLRWSRDRPGTIADDRQEIRPERGNIGRSLSSDRPIAQDRLTDVRCQRPAPVRPASCRLGVRGRMGSKRPDPSFNNQKPFCKQGIIWVRYFESCISNRTLSRPSPLEVGTDPDRDLGPVAQEAPADRIAEPPAQQA